MNLEVKRNKAVTMWHILHQALAVKNLWKFQYRQYSLIRYLFQSKTLDPNALTSSSQTLLHLLCLYPINEERWELLLINNKNIKFLLRCGVDFNHKDDRGYTALMLACQNGYTSVVYALLEWTHSTNTELDLDAVNSSGETAIMIAALNANCDAFNLLTSELILRSIVKKQETYRCKILNISRERFSRCFELQCLQPISKQFMKLNLPALEIEYLDYIKFFDLLLGLYLDRELTSEEILDLVSRLKECMLEIERNGWTTLYMAMFLYPRQFTEKQLKTVAIILKSEKFDVNTSTNQSETVLHFACRCSTCDEKAARELEEIIEILLDHKVNVNQRNSSGKTALMIACENNNVVAVRQLLNWRHVDSNMYQKHNWRKVDIESEDLKGHTALSIAKQSNNAEIVAIIEDVLFLKAAENNEPETVQMYLNSAYDEIQSKRSEKKFEFPENHSISHSAWLEALWIADDKGFEDIYNILITDDRYFHSCDNDGERILHVAIKEYFETIDKHCEPNDDRKVYRKVEMLLFSGKCDVNALNLHEETVLHLISDIRSFFCRICDSSKRLLKLIFKQQGIEINHRNVHGKTALVLASENEFDVFIEYLLKFSLNSDIHLDIDAVNNSGENALMKTKRKYDKYLSAMLCRKALLAAIENEEKEVDDRETDEEFTKAFRNFLQNSQSEIGLETWKETVISANFDSKAILDLLLEYDATVQRQNSCSERGDTSFDFLFTPGKCTSIHRLCLLKILLKSQRCDINAKNFSAQTVLHSVIFECYQTIEDYHKYVNGVDMEIDLLLRHGVNANAKDKDGSTALALASKHQLTSIMRIILNWATETGSRLDLDAKDTEGRTALMYSATLKNVDGVKMLIQAGASVSLSDNRGYTALHHALFVEPSFVEWIKFGSFPENYEEFKKRNETCAISFRNTYPNFNYNIGLGTYRTKHGFDEDMKKTVDLLLSCSCVDVNALENEGLSPLDMAIGSIPGVPSYIICSLNQKSAMLNVLQQAATNCDLESDNLCSAWKTLLLRLTATMKSPFRHYYDSDDFRNFMEEVEENFSKLSSTEKRQVISVRDEKMRTPLHRAVISQNFEYAEDSDETLIGVIRTLISFGFSVNEIDIYGRTPLHYAGHQDYKFILLENRAYELIKDKTEITAIEMSEMLIETNKCRIKKHYTELIIDYVDHYLRHIEKVLQNLSVGSSILPSCYQHLILLAISETMMLYRKETDDILKNTDGICSAKRSKMLQEINKRNDKFTSEIMEMIIGLDLDIDCKKDMFQFLSVGCDDTMQFSEHLTVPEILWQVGDYAFRYPKVNDYTKEIIDFMENLASEISRLDPRFEVKLIFVGSSSEGTRIDYPNEFDFQLALNKFSQICEVFQSPELPTGYMHLRQKDGTKESDMDRFFNKDGHLITDRVNEKFRFLLNRVLLDGRFVVDNLNFDWFSIFEEVCSGLVTTLKLRKMNLDLKDENSFLKISIDIVPCIQIDGWWPDDAIFNVSEEIRTIGCSLIFAQPQRLYPWVPFSESCAKISFAKAESEMIRQSPDEAKKAHMIGKQLIKTIKENKSSSNASYILKNSLLYSIEAFQSALKLLGNQVDFHRWLESLMKCLYLFYLMDFCPCYFMPKFTLPFEKYRDDFNIRCSPPDNILSFSVDHDYCKLHLVAALHGSHRHVPFRESDFCFKMSFFNRVFERFDRCALITELSKIAQNKLNV